MHTCMQDSEYQSWFDEASAPPPQGTHAEDAGAHAGGGVEAALDAALGGGAGSRALPGTPLDASVRAPWQAASAAVLQELLRALQSVAGDEAGGGGRAAEVPALQAAARELLFPGGGDEDVLTTVQTALSTLGFQGRNCWTAATQGRCRPACLLSSRCVCVLGTVCGRAGMAWPFGTHGRLRAWCGAAGCYSFPSPTSPTRPPRPRSWPRSG